MGVTVAYPGYDTVSLIKLYPLAPYTPFQLPCVVVSVFTNVAVAVHPEVEAPGTFRLPERQASPLNFGELGWLTMIVPAWPELGIAIPVAAATTTELTCTGAGEFGALGEMLKVAVASGPALITF